MPKIKIALSFSLLMLVTLACSLFSNLQAIQTQIPTLQTQIPAMITAAPTMLGPLETAAAQVTPPVMPTDSSSDTKNPGPGLGISIEKVKSVLEASQQFTFTDGTVDGQPAMTARLSSTFATSMPGLAENFSAVFIGDPQDVNTIRVSVPGSEDQVAIQAGMSMLTVIFAGILPADAMISALPWITENYSKIPVGGSKEMTSGNFKFILSKTETIVILDIVAVE